MRSFRGFIRHITDPTDGALEEELRRRLRVLLSVLVVGAAIWLLILLSLPLVLIFVVSPSQRIAEGTLYFAVLVSVGIPLGFSYTSAHAGRFGLGARLMVYPILFMTFVYMFASPTSSVSLDLPLVALALSGALLKPVETAAGFLASIIADILLVAERGIPLSDLSTALFVLAAVGILTTASVVLRERDLRQIRRQTAELTKNQERLANAHKMESVARLSAGLAHEFNNLMTAIGGYAKIIRKHPTEPSGKWASRIEKASWRAVKLTDGLLAFSQQQLVNPQSADLNELIRSELTRFRSVLRATTHILVRPSTEPKYVRIDSGLFADAMETLVSEAERHLAGPGTIAVGTDSVVLSEENGMRLPSGIYYSVVISDDGAAMGDAERARVFDPFFTTGDFGTGTLDLAAAYGIIRQSGGHIEVSGGPDNPNTLLVILPALNPAPGVK